MLKRSESGTSWGSVNLGRHGYQLSSQVESYSAPDSRQNRQRTASLDTSRRIKGSSIYDESNFSAKRAQSLFARKKPFEPTLKYKIALPVSEKCSEECVTMLQKRKQQPMSFRRT